MTKFYEAENCNRKIESNGNSYRFHPWGTIGGSLCGVFCAQTEQEIVDMDALVKTQKSLISPISEEEYNHRLGIRALRQPSSFLSADSGPGQRQPKPLPSTIAEQARIRTDVENSPGKQAPAVVLEAEIVSKVAAEPVKSDDILKPGRVEPAKK